MDKLGINPTLILFQVINFFVLMFILKKFLYKPILTMFDKRKQNVEKAEELRQELEKEKASLGDEKNKLISEAKDEASHILTEVHKQGEEIKRKTEKEAREQAQQIIARAEEQNGVLEQTLRQELAQDVQKTAINVAETVLSKTMTDEQRNMILEQSAKEFAQS